MLKYKIFNNTEEFEQFQQDNDIGIHTIQPIQEIAGMHFNINSGGINLNGSFKPEGYPPVGSPLAHAPGIQFELHGGTGGGNINGGLMVVHKIMVFYYDVEKDGKRVL